MFDGDQQGIIFQNTDPGKIRLCAVLILFKSHKPAVIGRRYAQSADLLRAQ